MTMRAQDPLGRTRGAPWPEARALVATERIVVDRSIADEFTVDGVDEAVRVANDTEYGLAAAVFSRDVAGALEVAHRIESGICHVNDAHRAGRAADAVRRRQGQRVRRFGWPRGARGVHQLRWITVQDTERHYPI